MRRELHEQFNREVEGYRKALLYHARACDWDAFKAKAGRLFDYVESIEFSELERRFFAVFTPVLIALSFAVIALLGVDFSVHAEWLRFRNLLILTALMAGCFEFYYYRAYQSYLKLKARYARRRRELFILHIEADFRGFALQT